MKTSDILRKKDFTFSVELVPPRNGAPPEEIFGKIASLRGMVDFVSVTKGAGGSLRGGTLPISYIAQEEYGISTIAHFVCRERTREEIENDLMDLHYLGIKNVLALRGDPPAGSDEGWKGDYQYAYLLVQQIKNMNRGIYLPRRGQDGHFREGIKTDFCIMVAGHPEDPIEDEIAHMKAKVEAGAEATITQMVFSFEDYQRYARALREGGITLPVLAGIRPLLSYEQAQSTEAFFKLHVNAQLKSGLRERGREFGISYAAEMITKLRANHAPGVHLFVLNDVDIVKEILSQIQ